MLKITETVKLEQYKNQRGAYFWHNTHVDDNPYLESVQKELWSNVGKTKVAFIIFAIATMSLICNSNHVTYHRIEVNKEFENK